MSCIERLTQLYLIITQIQGEFIPRIRADLLGELKAVIKVMLQHHSIASLDSSGANVFRSATTYLQSIFNDSCEVVSSY